MADRADPFALPTKLFFRIGEVAGLVGVEPHVLRYWEREFRSIRPTKSKKGQRVYSRKDVENLLRVRDLLYRDGFTIAGAKKQLQRGGVEPLARVGVTTESSAAVGELRSMHTALVATDDGAEFDDESHPEFGGDMDDVEGEAFAPFGEGASRDSITGVKTPSAFDPKDLVDDASRARGSSNRDRVREELAALRAEVEGFLLELEGTLEADDARATAR